MGSMTNDDKIQLLMLMREIYCDILSMELCKRPPGDASETAQALGLDEDEYHEIVVIMQELYEAGRAMPTIWRMNVAGVQVQETLLNDKLQRRCWGGD